MSRDAWNPEQYERFKAERSAPFHDLLRLVEARAGMRVADLGCGTGELSAVVHETLEASETIAIDRSAAMLEKAAGHAGSGLRFRNADIAELDEAEGFDLVFSNAALHWLADHRGLLKRLTRMLRADGQLAVQIPANHDQPSHRCSVQIARSEPFASELDGFVTPVHVLQVEEYARILYELGYREQRVEMRVYGHRLNEPREVVEWVKGALLTPYQGRLSASAYARFVASYEEALLDELADERPFFFPYKRIFFWARR